MNKHIEKIMKKLIGNLTKADIKKLKAGEEVLYSGSLYTARDQAHKRLAGLIKQGRKLPFDIKNKIIYYCGPNPAKKGRIVGACGPTTSGRMDEFTPLLLKKGLLATVGKGERSDEVIRAIKQNRAVYFVTYAGCGALLSEYVTGRKPVCFKDLGAEAVYEFEVKDFPLVVAIDPKGDNIYDKIR